MPCEARREKFSAALPTPLLYHSTGMHARFSWGGGGGGGGGSVAPPAPMLGTALASHGVRYM